MRAHTSFLVSLLLPAFLYAAPALATDEIGKVISFAPGATLLRDGKNEGLDMHAGIRVSDTVQTDAGGRVKILFNDDSSLSLGPNTVMEMSEYADAGAKSAFNVNVPQGMVRAITGKIVEQNPNGFKMSSPEATVGIRGTIVTMHTERRQDGKRHTRVYVENTLRSVHVNGRNVPSGDKVTIDSDGNSQQGRITREDRQHISRGLGQRSAAAAPEGGRGGGRRATDQFAAGGKGLLPEDTLKDDSQATSLLNNTIAQQIMPVGHVSGSFSTGSGGIGSGNFGFDVNLGSGAITNGTFNHNGDSAMLNGWVSNLSGGTGLANATGFSMGVQGAATYYGATGHSASATVSGSGTNLLTAPSGSSFTVNYGISYDGGSGSFDSGGGTTPATITRK
jgi:hypothetical protein